MEAKLQEMLMIARPTSGDGRIPLNELKEILPKIGFDFLVDEIPKLQPELDPSGSGTQNLRQALATFDYDNDGKLPYEELEYFLRNFGETEHSYIDEARMKQLLEMSKPLDKNGNVDLDLFVQNLTNCWRNYGK